MVVLLLDMVIITVANDGDSDATNGNWKLKLWFVERDFFSSLSIPESDKFYLFILQNDRTFTKLLAHNPPYTVDVVVVIEPGL